MYLSDIKNIIGALICAITPRELLDAVRYSVNNSSEMLRGKNMAIYLAKMTVLTIVACLCVYWFCQLIGLDPEPAMRFIRRFMMGMYAFMMIAELAYFFIYGGDHNV